MAFENETAAIQAVTQLLTGTVIPGIDKLKELVANGGDTTQLDAALTEMQAAVQATVSDLPQA